MPAAALAGAVLAFGLVLIYLSVSPQSGRYNDADIQRLAAEQQSKATPTPPVEPAIYQLVRPAVVLITQDISTPDKGPGKGIGAGVVFDQNGSILTAYHVVSASDNVTIRFYDGSTSPGTVVQKEPDRDLAVVHVQKLPDGIQPAVLGGGVDYGDEVLAIGAPFGLDGSVTSGIVSGLGRSFTVEETGQVLTNMIQFDAAVKSWQLRRPFDRPRRPRGRHRVRHRQPKRQQRVHRSRIRSADRERVWHRRARNLRNEQQEAP